VGDLKPGDEFIGSDGKWHKIKPLDTKTSVTMYQLYFSNGYVKCSGDHQWTIFGNDGKPVTTTTDIVVETAENNPDIRFGNPKGPYLKTYKMVQNETVRCLQLLDDDGSELPEDVGDHLFDIITQQNYHNSVDLNLYEGAVFPLLSGYLTAKVVEIDEKNSALMLEITNNENNENMGLGVFTTKDIEKLYYSGDVLTHNCTFRMVCGRLNSTASIMALGNTQATSINKDHPGAGMVSANGIISNIQYYFEEIKYIKKWYADRGLTEKGYLPGQDPNEKIDPNTIDLGDDNEEITLERNTVDMKYEGIEKKIDKSKNQEFKEL
jgi:hypothetical protein